MDESSQVEMLDDVIIGLFDCLFQVGESSGMLSKGVEDGRGQVI